MPNAMPARLPNKGPLVSDVPRKGAGVDGSEPLPSGGSSVTSAQGAADFGKGQTAAPISNNDVSKTHGS
jgi:hypothetical protein